LIDSIMEAVKALLDRDREVVQARIDGLSHTEISERFGISVQASMNRLSRARRRIAAHLKGLLNVIFGLPKTLPLKKLISGGITAMKIGIAAKVSIGVIVAVIVGFIGFRVWKPSHQDTQQLEVKSKQQTTRAVSQPTLHEPSSESKETIQDGQEQEIEEAPARLDSMASGGKTEDIQPAVAPKTEVSKANQDQSKVEYHKAYDTFIGVTKKIRHTKAKMVRIKKEIKRVRAEWKRRVLDPKNPTAEEKAELGEEITPLRGEHSELESDLNSLANELVSEVEAVAPGAIQTESEDTPRGTLNFVSIDYEHIQSELGSLSEEDNANLAEFFVGFEIKSHPSTGWSSVNIGK